MGHFGIAFASQGSALLDPAAHHAVERGVGFNPLSAAMSEDAGRLEKEKAAFGSGGEQSSASVFLDQEFVILRRLKAEERQREAVLSPRLTMAAAGIATELG